MQRERDGFDEQRAEEQPGLFPIRRPSSWRRGKLSGALARALARAV